MSTLSAIVLGIAWGTALLLLLCAWRTWRMSPEAWWRAQRDINRHVIAAARGATGDGVLPATASGRQPDARDLKSKVEQLEESARRQQAALIAARDAIEQVECPQQHQVVDVLRKINAALRQK